MLMKSIYMQTDLFDIIMIQRLPQMVNNLTSNFNQRKTFHNYSQKKFIWK